MTSKTSMIEAIKIAGSEFPELVFDYYIAEGLIKSSTRGFSVVHGCFLDGDVIARADNAARIAYLQRIIDESPQMPKARNAQLLIDDLRAQ